MKKQSIWIILCLMLLVTFLPITFLDAQATINLTGSVKGKRGDTKQFVTVNLIGPRNYIALTDSGGSFYVNDLIPGQYTVTVTQDPNLQTFSVTIRGQTTLNLVVKW